MAKHPVSTTYGTDITAATNKGGSVLQIKSMLTGDIIQFPAFLTSFSQSWTSNWNEEEIYGRMDPIATFQGTKRSISLGFDLPSPELKVAKHNLKGCDLLAQFLYPGYIKQTDVGFEQGDNVKQQGNIIARPPLAAVKYTNLISAGGAFQLGYITGLEWAPDLEMGAFHESDKIFPKVISLSFTFNVLHQGDRGFGADNKWVSNTKFFSGY
tara:strand:- start:299 stop:931 length:633 start_codon:yes stop_codon:yes gene_type:complete